MKKNYFALDVLQVICKHMTLRRNNILLKCYRCKLSKDVYRIHVQPLELAPYSCKYYTISAHVGYGNWTPTNLLPSPS